MNEYYTVDVWFECSPNMTDHKRFSDVKKIQLFTEGNVTILSLLRDYSTNTSFPLNRVIRYQIVELDKEGE